MKSQNNQNSTIKTYTNFIQNLTKQLSSCTQSTSAISASALEAIKLKDRKKLFSICESGLPDDLPILRAYIWKINLNYLPLEVKEWDSTLEKKRNEYKKYRIQR